MASRKRSAAADGCCSCCSISSATFCSRLKLCAAMLTLLLATLTAVWVQPLRYYAVIVGALVVVTYFMLWQYAPCDRRRVKKIVLDHVDDAVVRCAKRWRGATSSKKKRHSHRTDSDRRRDARHHDERETATVFSQTDRDEDASEYTDCARHPTLNNKSSIEGRAIPFSSRAPYGAVALPPPYTSAGMFFVDAAVQRPHTMIDMRAAGPQVTKQRQQAHESPPTVTKARRKSQKNTDPYDDDEDNSIVGSAGG